MVCAIRKICCVCCAALALFMVSAQGVAAGDDDMSDLLLQASRSYKEGSYDEAVAQYESILAAGISNGRLYYNLGNAYMRTGQPGRALLNYRRAELRMPRNDDLRSNIQYALTQARDSIECRGFAVTLRDICFWYTRMSATEIIWTAIACNILFWLLLLVRFFYRREGLTIGLTLVLFLTVIFGSSAAVKHYTMAYAPRGVVVAPEIQVRSGTSLNDTVLFKLHEAAEFVWEEERDGCVRIGLCDGKKGWVQAGSIAKVQ
jgi:tetratricopeptide (TPR) repeat protein